MCVLFDRRNRFAANLFQVYVDAGATAGTNPGADDVDVAVAESGAAACQARCNASRAAEGADGCDRFEHVRWPDASTGRCRVYRSGSVGSWYTLGSSLFRTGVPNADFAGSRMYAEYTLHIHRGTCLTVVALSARLASLLGRFACLASARLRPCSSVTHLPERVCATTPMLPVRWAWIIAWCRVREVWRLQSVHLDCACCAAQRSADACAQTIDRPVDVGSI